MKRSLLYMIVFAILFLIASLPFLFGMMSSGFEDKNPYALFYSFFNYPATLLLGKAIHWFTVEMWEYPTFEQVQVTTYTAYTAFWALLGMLIGFYKDYKEGAGS